MIQKVQHPVGGSSDSSLINQQPRILPRSMTNNGVSCSIADPTKSFASSTGINNTGILPHTTKFSEAHTQSSLHRQNLYGSIYNQDSMPTNNHSSFVMQQSHNGGSVGGLPSHAAMIGLPAKTGSHSLQPSSINHTIAQKSTILSAR